MVSKRVHGHLKRISYSPTIFTLMDLEIGETSPRMQVYNDVARVAVSRWTNYLRPDIKREAFSLLKKKRPSFSFTVSWETTIGNVTPSFLNLQGWRPSFDEPQFLKLAATATLLLSIPRQFNSFLSWQCNRVLTPHLLHHLNAELNSTSSTYVNKKARRTEEGTRLPAYEIQVRNSGEFGH
ncbi:hypothetical protein ACSQ67_026011 [Phaseolus vulgaris]